MAAMAGLAPKLGDLLMSEYVAHKGLKPDMESLCRELALIHAALFDLSQVPPDQLGEADKLWAREVRELTYDVEDAVDGFMLRVELAESAAASAATDGSNVLKKILGKVPAAVERIKNRRKIDDKVKEIKKLSMELAELRAQYTVRGLAVVAAAEGSSRC